MTTKQKIHKYLLSHKSEKKAVHLKELERVIQIEPRTIRRHINDLRQSGIPICSSDKGYWIGKDSSEVIKTIKRLNDMSNGINSTKKELIVTSVRMLNIKEISVEIK